MGRVAIVVAAAAVAAGVLGGCGHGSGTAPDANTAGAAGKPPAASTVRTINIKVHGGKADEIHVHGYDRKANVPAGATASVVFSANNPGVFEVELENSKLQLVQLQVG